VIQEALPDSVVERVDEVILSNVSWSVGREDIILSWAALWEYDESMLFNISRHFFNRGKLRIHKGSFPS
jgi:hypothetical protein